MLITDGQLFSLSPLLILFQSLLTQNLILTSSYARSTLLLQIQSQTLLLMILFPFLLRLTFQMFLLLLLLLLMLMFRFRLFTPPRPFLLSFPSLTVPTTVKTTPKLGLLYDT